MYKALESLRDRGYSDWQTLTSFLANLLIDQDNPHRMLKTLVDETRLKINMMRDERRKAEHC
jgi:hypothetical protein